MNIFLIILPILMIASFYFPDKIIIKENIHYTIFTKKYYLDEAFVIILIIFFLYYLYSNLINYFRTKNKSQFDISYNIAILCTGVFLSYSSIIQILDNTWNIKFLENKIIYSTILRSSSIPIEKIQSVDLNKNISSDGRSLFFGVTEYFNFKIEYMNSSNKVESIYFSQSQKKSIFGININDNNYYDNIISNIVSHLKIYKNINISNGT